MLEDRAQRNKLRGVIDKAEKKKVVTREEAGFAITLAERYRSDIEKKTKQLFVLQGEIAQLRANEQIIMDLIQNMIKTAERDKARQETHNRIRARKAESEEEQEEQKEQ